MWDAEDTEGINQLIEDPTFTKTFEQLDCYDKGFIAHLIGKNFYIQNREVEAIRWFKDAVEQYWKSCAEAKEDEVSNALFNIGIAYQYTDQQLMGKRYIDSAMVVISKIPEYDPYSLALKYQGAGSYYAQIRDYTKSNAYFKNAKKLSNHLDPLDAYYLNIDYLTLMIKFRKYEDALQLIREIEAEFLQNQSISDSYDVAIFELNAAEVYLEKGELEQAEKLSKHALSILPEEEVGLQSNAFEILGVMYFRSENLAESRKYYERAYKIRQDEKNMIQQGLAQSFALENLAELEMKAGDLSKAMEYINQAIKLHNSTIQFDQNGDPIIKKQMVFNGFHLSRQLHIKAQIISKESAGESQQQNLQRSLGIFMKIDSLNKIILTNAFLDEAKLELLGTMNHFTSDAIEVCKRLYGLSHEQAYLERILYFSSASKAAVLSTLVASNRQLMFDASDSLVNRYFALKSELNQMQINEVQNQDGNNISDAYTSTLSELEDLQDAISGMGTDQFQHLPVNGLVQTIQNRIRPGMLVIDVFTDDEKMTLSYLTRDTFFVRDFDKALWAENLKVIKENLRSPAGRFQDGGPRALYKMFFDSLKEIHDLKHIHFIPDGEVNGLPIEVLIDGYGDYLLSNHNISYGFVASALLQQRRKPHFEKQFAGFATTYSDSLSARLEQEGFDQKKAKLTQLSSANEELVQCADLFGESAFLNQAATVDQFYAQALHARVVYLSLHGIVDHEDGSRSAIVFDDRSPDFLLHAYELTRQPIAADLVVLSSCDTADGQLKEGEGIIGMSRAFLSSGVNSLISSLWSATEKSSLNILPSFLSQVKKGQTRHESLREAKLAYIKNAPPSQQHPYYWANFVLIENADFLAEEKDLGHVPFYILVVVITLALTIVLLKNRKVKEAGGLSI